MKRDHFTIAEELLLRIFRYLPYDDLTKVRLVCRVFARVGFEIMCHTLEYRTESYNNNRYQGTVKDASARDFVRKIIITNEAGLQEDEEFRELGNDLTKLVWFKELQDIEIVFTENSWARGASFFALMRRLLEFLEIKKKKAGIFASRLCGHEDCMPLYYQSLVTPDAPDHCETCPTRACAPADRQLDWQGLTSLTLTGSHEYQFPPSTLQDSSIYRARLPSLKKLKLANYSIGTHGTIAWILSHGETLQELDLPNCPLVVLVVVEGASRRDADDFIDGIGSLRQAMLDIFTDMKVHVQHDKIIIELGNSWPALMDVFLKRLPALRKFGVLAREGCDQESLKHVERHWGDYPPYAMQRWQKEHGEMYLVREPKRMETRFGSDDPAVFVVGNDNTAAFNNTGTYPSDLRPVQGSSGLVIRSFALSHNVKDDLHAIATFSEHIKQRIPEHYNCTTHTASIASYVKEYSHSSSIPAVMRFHVMTYTEPGDVPMMSELQRLRMDSRNDLSLKDCQEAYSCLQKLCGDPYSPSSADILSREFPPGQVEQPPQQIRVRELHYRKGQLMVKFLSDFGVMLLEDYLDFLGVPKHRAVQIVGDPVWHPDIDRRVDSQYRLTSQQHGEKSFRHSANGDVFTAHLHRWDGMVFGTTVHKWGHVEETESGWVPRDRLVPLERSRVRSRIKRPAPRMDLDSGPRKRSCGRYELR